MIQDTRQETHGETRERGGLESCTGCSTEIVSDPVAGGLNCASFVQWQALCESCMPAVAEHSRDAAWVCPDCRQ
jgi:predicted RNA-binding Zn-ribbon protein involved in translation (DUF1610 family)